MPTGMRVNGSTLAAPTSPLGRPDVLYGLMGSGGLLTEWAETVPDLMWPESVRTYGRMRRDPKLTAVLSAFFLPIMRCNWAVDPEGVKEAKAVELVAGDLGLPILGTKGRVSESPVKGFRWREHVRLALLRLVYGHMPFEQWYVQRDGLTHLAGLAERQPHTIAMIEVDDQGQIREVLQNTQTEPIPANRWLWYTNDREGANWTGTSLLRSCYTPWVLKHEVMRVHATSHRRWGMGVPVVHAPPGGTPAQVAEAQRLAAGMRAGEQAGVGLPDGFTFEIAGMTGSVPDAVAFVNLLNQEMAGSALAKVIELGSTAVGSRALGDTFLDLFLLALQAAADVIGDTATYGDPTMPGISRALTEYNWGEGEPCPRIIATDVGDRHQITAMAVQQLVSSGAIQADDELEAFVRDAWALPKRTTPRLMPPPAAPRPGSGGLGGTPPKGEAGGPPPPVPGLPKPAPAMPAQQAAPPAAPATKAPAAGNMFAPAAAARPDGLRRDLTPAEIRAAHDPAAISRELEIARDHLLSAWVPVLAEQRADLADQVSAAVDDGRLDRLAHMTANSGPGADLLYATMRQVADRAARRMIGEAAAQGIDIDITQVQVDEGRLRQLAKARAALAAAHLTTQASRRALQVVTASAGSEAAQQVTATLAGLSPTSLGDELLAAMHAAANAGRFAVLEEGPDASYVASEISDSSTCRPCSLIDGYTFENLEAAEADYLNGAYIGCLGQLRCRGTVVATWPDLPRPF